MNDSQLAATMKEAFTIRAKMKAAGQSQVEIDAYLEGVLREAWPKGRVWRYLCDRCEDTGLVMRVCRTGDRCAGISSRIDSPTDRPGKYRRLCALHPDSDYEHDYGEPCWCAAGKRYRPTERTPETEVEAAARTTKPTRLGR